MADDETNENATTADKIAANSVTTVKLTADAVTADRLTADSVQAGNVTALAGRDGKDDSDVSASGVLDLRPPQESLKAELCRLGLEYSSTDAAGVESWRDYHIRRDGGQCRDHGREDESRTHLDARWA